MRNHDFKKFNYKITFDENIGKPLKHCQNSGNIFFFNYYYHYHNFIQKKSVLEKKNCLLLANLSKKLKNLKTFDLRDLCIKRGKLTRKLTIKLFFNKKLKFDYYRFFNGFSFSSLKKELIFDNLNKHSIENFKLREKTDLKGLLKTSIIFGELNKISKQEFEKKNKELFLNLNNTNINKQRKIVIKSDISDKKLESCNLIFLLFKLACKKKLALFTNPFRIP